MGKSKFVNLPERAFGPNARTRLGHTPVVHVLSRSTLCDEHREFLRHHGTVWHQITEDREVTPAERLIEFAGRICYMSFSRPAPRTNAEYIARLINQGHESVLEHANWTFVVSGVSRACTHQLVRHRAGFSYSQLSQQYHDESQADFVEPHELERHPELREIWRRATGAALDAYREILTKLDADSLEGRSLHDKAEVRRAIRSIARSVLPNATATAIMITANGRALRHFFQVRGSILGDEEMRRVSAAIFRAVKPDAPAIFFDFVAEELPDGSPIVRHLSKSGI